MNTGNLKGKGNCGGTVGAHRIHTKGGGPVYLGGISMTVPKNTPGLTPGSAHHPCALTTTSNWSCVSVSFPQCSDSGVGSTHWACQGASFQWRIPPNRQHVQMLSTERRQLSTLETKELSSRLCLQA